MQQQYVITFAGVDRTGLVESIADLVTSHGGDWQQSELTRLGGAFAGAILINVSPDSVAPLSRDLEEKGDDNLTLHMTPAARKPALEPNLRLTLTGPNRPGIVYEVTHELADSDINIVQFSSRVESAAWSGEPIFIAELAARSPESLNLPDLRDRLDVIENNMTLEIDIETNAD